MNDPIAYAFEPEDFDKLRAINRQLFGDGTQLSPDKRRDLANVMREVLARALPLDDTP